MTFTMDLDPDSEQIIHIKLFRNVRNVRELHEKIINGDLKCCIIKPSLICDPFQVVVAANKAVTSPNLTTKTIFTEILFNLSISSNIAQSLRKFGVESDVDMLIVTLNRKSEESNMSEVIKEVDGDEVGVEDLKELVDFDAIKKAYKISYLECDTNLILDSVVSRIVTKDFVSH